MTQLTDEHSAWQKGFEAGVVFAVRHLSVDDDFNIDISKLVSDVVALRVWKSEVEWWELVEKSYDVMED